ncbi:hypothetical protein [Streptomyces sp. KL116D]|uniref:hypothetical protein n=1 Tax=Streptomyces sp. KL116D TaxID=3045152 RepID=UPI003557FFF3
MSGATVSVTLDGRTRAPSPSRRSGHHGVGVHARDGQRALWEELTVTGADGAALYADL